MTAPRSVGFFGKLPNAGDFQRHGLDAAWARRLYDWCVDGWSRSLASGAVRDLDAPLRLVVRLDGGGHTAALVLHPSRDRVGRRFPFAIVGEFAFDAASPGEIVLAADAWLSRAAPTAELASRGLDAAALRAHVDALRGGAVDAGAVAHRDWRRTAAAATLRTADAEGRTAEWVRALEFARSPAGTPEYVVRGGPAPSLDALAATVDLFAALGPQPVRAVAWDERGGRTLSWRLLCDELQTRYLRPLFWRDAPGEAAWDVAPANQSVPASFAGRLAARVDVDAATVHDLVEAASR